jgi:hypothetical protein
MIKGSEVRKADHQIETFLIDRWSPRAMSGEEISREVNSRAHIKIENGLVSAERGCDFGSWKKL